MAKQSAGLLLYRYRPGLQVLIVHPGGPVWARRDEGAWSIPKGEVELGEEPAEVAAREFAEELGRPPPNGERRPLGEVTQAGGKRVSAWALRADFDASVIVSNEFELEWPPRSGKVRSYPEIDRAEWVDTDSARVRVNAAQRAFIDRLEALDDP